MQDATLKWLGVRPSRTSDLTKLFFANSFLLTLRYLQKLLASAFNGIGYRTMGAVVHFLRYRVALR